MSIESKNYVDAFPIGQRAIDILRLLGECPATSFHESLVSRCILDLLDNTQIDYRVDRYGNIVAKVGSRVGAPSESSPIADRKSVV